MKNDLKKLIGFQCEKCGKRYVPPIYNCSECGHGQFKEFEFTGKGTIRTYTIIRVPPLGFENQVPYSLAVVRLEEGINVTARITGPHEELKIGAPVTYDRGKEGVHYFRTA